MTDFYAMSPMPPSSPCPFEEMQKAVDIVNTSLHSANKIAATLFGDGFSISRTNYWPKHIASHFGMDTRIGNSSGTVHAETACILAAPMTEGASLCVTDPFCPNCAKNIAEAGIKTIYIDHKGFDKDFAARRGGHFQDMSMQVCEKAGISIYELRRKEKTLAPILQVSGDYRPANDAPVIVSSVPRADQAIFLDLIAESKANLQGENTLLRWRRTPGGRLSDFVQDHIWRSGIRGGLTIPSFMMRTESTVSSLSPQTG